MNLSIAREHEEIQTTAGCTVFRGEWAGVEKPDSEGSEMLGYPGINTGAPLMSLALHNALQKLLFSADGMALRGSRVAGKMVSCVTRSIA
jgi:hypothetical protein